MRHIHSTSPLNYSPSPLTCRMCTPPMDTTANSHSPSPVRSPYHRPWIGWEKLCCQTSSGCTPNTISQNQTASKSNSNKCTHLLHITCTPVLAECIKKRTIIEIDTIDTGLRKNRTLPYVPKSSSFLPSQSTSATAEHRTLSWRWEEGRTKERSKPHSKTFLEKKHSNVQNSKEVIVPGSHEHDTQFYSRADQEVIITQLALIIRHIIWVSH